MPSGRLVRAALDAPMVARASDHLPLVTVIEG